ncbi:hypothetical protein M2161_009270 [Streptomyces sp. SAI-133]|uniref:hypothetical protein n=1 Tax=unclassified Streptomyces TaxID=2593676 RepID=UPI002473F41B|nr:hypothetical protein [Streptomyces sp. SAI-133]MDH6590079.1 hypothetical protein [Streptomyces sp. SAI-133]
MHDFTLDENARTLADDLLDEMLVSAHAELVDAIAAQQYRSVIAAVTSRPPQQVDLKDQSSQEDDRIAELAEQWVSYADRSEGGVAGPAFQAALEALQRVYMAFRRVQEEDYLRTRASDAQLEAAARLVLVMGVALQRRTADRQMTEKSFSYLLEMIRVWRVNGDLEDETQEELEDLLYDANEAVDYLFDASDDFEGAPA